MACMATTHSHRAAVAELVSTRFGLPILLCLASTAIFLFILTTKFNSDFSAHPDTEYPILDCALLHNRGIKLLHTLPDEELLDLAGSSDNNSSNLRYLPCRSNSSKPKIAFLFLTTGSLPLAPFWEQFLRGSEALFNIYIHSDPFFLDSPFDPSSPFWGRLIPSSKTQYDTPLIIAALRRLFANAILDDPNNEFFAILSDSCIPIHGFQRIYDTITASNRSFTEVFSGDRHLKHRYNGRGDGVMLPEVKLADFRAGSVFSVIKRRHAIMYVKDKRFWAKFKLNCVRKGCFPEEHYFPTVMNMLDPFGATNYSLTFVDWNKTRGHHPAQDSHPRMFMKEELNEMSITDLQQSNGGQFMFARKFDIASLYTLLNMSHIVLDKNKTI